MAGRTWIIANVKYKSPKRSRRGHGGRALRNMLKYLQYRDNADQHLTQDAKRERWVDAGMGDSYKTIWQNCAQAQSEHVLAWTWVISPEPDVMQLIPAAKRTQFMQDLTKSIVESYYEKRDLEPCYSYVVHHAQTQDGRPHTHSHIILPGTVEKHLEQRQDMVFYKDKDHFTMLDAIANAELERHLEQALGKRKLLELQLGLLDDADIAR